MNTQASAGTGMGTDAIAPPQRHLIRQQLTALVRYTVQEARHRWTLVALFALTSLFLLLLLTLVNVDVVEGTVASARLFGTWDLPVNGQTIRISDAVTVLQSLIVGFISTFGLLLAIFLSGNIISRTMRVGWVDLLASQPVSRTTLLLGRTLGAVVVIGLSLAYLFGGSWAILTWKTGFGNAGFLLAGSLILFTFLACFAGMVLVGVVTRSSPVSNLAGVGIWLFGQILYPLHHFDNWSTAFRAGWPRTLANGLAEALYWLMPKTAELTSNAVEATRLQAVSPWPVLSSVPFVVLCLALACWWFARQDT